jgi:hypothetical protein
MIFKNIIKIGRNGKRRSDNTINTYGYDWKNAIKLFYPNDENIDLNNEKYLKILDFDLSKIEKKVEQIEKIRRRKRILNIIEILAFDLKKERVDVKRLVIKINEEIQDIGDQNQKSIKEKQNWISFKEYDEIIKNLNDEVEEIFKNRLTRSYVNKKKIQNLIIYKFYRTHHLRNDIAKLKIISSKEYKKIEDDNDDKTNYLIIDNKNSFVILNEYKTHKFTDRKKIIVSKDLAKLIRKYLKINTSGWLLVNRKNEPFTRTTFSTYFIRTSKKIFGKGFGSSLLRHIAISEKSKDGMSLQDRRKLSREMLHGIDMQHVYNKFD